MAYFHVSYITHPSCMVGEMVQNSKSLYSFTFNAVIVIHKYIYSYSTTNFTVKKYIYSHLMMYFFFTNIFTHIYEIYSFTFNGLYSFTFTIEIFIYHFLRTAFCASLGSSFRSIISERIRQMKGKPKTNNPKYKCCNGKNFFLQLSIPYKTANGNGISWK